MMLLPTAAPLLQLGAPGDGPDCRGARLAGASRIPRPRAAADEMLRRLARPGRRMVVVGEARAAGKEGGDRQRVRGRAVRRAWRQACAGALIPPAITTASRAG